MNLSESKTVTAERGNSPQLVVPGAHGHPKVMVSVAPNGGRKTKADHPMVPLNAEELARCAVETREAGASLIHIHVRDKAGRHLLDADAYRDALSAIRREVGDNLVLQITTESLGAYSPAEQIAVVKAVRPEAASLALRELVQSERDKSALADLLNWMRRENVSAQIILYDVPDIEKLSSLQRAGLIPKSLPLLFVLGRYTQAQVSGPMDLLPFLSATEARPAHWSVCAFGPREASCATTAALLGGHVRVGFENNLFLPNGQLAPSNAALVSAVADVLDKLGISLETPDGLRQAFRAFTD